MQLLALSIGEAVPRDNFDAVIQSAFDLAVNLRLEHEDRLITLLISEGYELPQGIRIWTNDLSFQSLAPGLRASARGGILRFDSSPLTVDLRNAPVWKCRVPELNLDMRTPAAQEAWSLAWDLLNLEQRHKKVDIVAEDLFREESGSMLSQKVGRPVEGLFVFTERFDTRGALHSAQKLIGLGPGVTPSGDDILIGFLAGLWSMAGQNKQQLEFIRSFGTELVHLAKHTSEISRTYLYHASQGQFSSSLSELSESIASGIDVEKLTRAAMSIGHSSGMDSVTGLLIGLCAWNTHAPAAVRGGGDGAQSIQTKDDL